MRINKGSEKRSISIFHSLDPLQPLIKQEESSCFTNFNFQGIASTTPSKHITKDANITRLHERQKELAMQNHRKDGKVIIDVRYPRKYEDATVIVDLLTGNESILIDFQYMTEVQARRCLDYLDGARHVLAGNMKKVASTMYLLTPVNVVVNIEDIKLPDDSQKC